MSPNPPRRSLPVRSRAPSNTGNAASSHRHPPTSTSETTTEAAATDQDDEGSKKKRGTTPKNNGSGYTKMKGGTGGEEGDIRDEQERGRVLVAVLANGKRFTVKIKLGKRKEELEPNVPQESEAPWVCHTCSKHNLPTKKRCGSCQSWRGGTRKNITGMKKSKTPPKATVTPKVKATPKEEPPPIEEAPPKVEKTSDDQEEEAEADVSMGARLPKRKRTNLYSSLSPAVISATAKARAEAFAAAPPSPQLASKVTLVAAKSVASKSITSKSIASRSNRIKQTYDKKAEGYPHPAAIAAENAASVSGGVVPDEFIGQDGNLFYCRICLGVGEVVCCDGCPHVFHQRCLPIGPSKTSLENDDDPWFCHECVENDKSGKLGSPSKRRRKIKERCSECRRKETKANPCVSCSGRNCDQYFHIVCPSRGDEDAVVHTSSQRFLCTSCKAALANSDKNGSHFEYDQHKLEDIQGARSSRLSPGGRGRGRGGRGRGRGGRGARGLRRMSSTEERMKRFKDSDEQGIINIRGRKRVYSSGFQAPYIENDDDDDAVGPELLAYVEQPFSSTPAFFFFLLHNRGVIEKSLFRKSPLFRGMPKGTARNEKVAEAGAAIWTGMTPKERKEWVVVSMKDFEQRVVAWKEKEVIEAMIKTMDDENQDTQGEEGEGEAPSIPPEDEIHIANSRARLNQYSKVKSQPVKVSASARGNPILLELLNDARFRPLPLVNTTRAKEDLVHGSEKVKVAVQQFTVQGPIETSLGDDCMGCTRGWSHFCSVLKRPIPSSEHRAKLQPPLSSLTATRIGLGLKVNLPREDDKEQCQPATNAAAELARICPNYQPRGGYSLSTPSLRLDDTTSFIESATAMKSMKLDTDGPVDGSTQLETDSSSPGKSKTLARGLLPLRGRKRKMSVDNSGQDEGDVESVTSNEEGEKEEQHKCMSCRTIQSNPFGCMPCRKSQLVTQMAKRNYCSPNSVADEFLKRSSSVDCPNYGDGFVKPLCVMLGRSSLNDTSISGRKKNLDSGLDKIGLSLTKESWTPNVIMPPNPKRLPTRKPRTLNSNVTISENGDSSSDESTTSGSSSSGHLNSEDGSAWECTKCSHRNDASRARCSSCQGWKGGKRDNIKNVRPRSCTSKAGEAEVSQDRHALALKHKDESNELSRKCLAIACCGILVGMIRRDPMRLFAEPVPADVGEYHEEIKDPIDFSTMRKKILSSEYTSLKTFIADARRLCINACVFNAADSLYAKTAKNIYDSLEVMHDRAKKWTTILKNSHASSFIANEDGKEGGEVDTFKDVKLMWPGAVELLEGGEWLKRQAASDFTRTRENEIAYYGSLAIQRAAATAKASLVTAQDLGGVKNPTVKRSHVQDELLRKHVDDEASLHVGPIQLKDEPDWREYQLLKLLKRVQKRRIEGRMSSESGCARCDGVKTSDETNKAVSLLRSKFKRTVDATKARVAASRLSQSTGLASRNARDIAAKKNVSVDIPLESVGQVATESMVSVRGSRTHGWGLFADQPFRTGEVVAEYIGEYVSEAVADLREKRYREQRIQDYQFRVDGSLVIDATLRGGYARYINHSCSPNCVAKIVNGKSPNNEHMKRVLIVSQREIQASEELSYDYQFPLEMNLDLRVPCNCGSKQCRGFMNWDTPEKKNAKIMKSSAGRRVRPRKSM